MVRYLKKTMIIGVTPDTALAKEAGLKLGIKESIVVNDRMETSVPDIYAAGDAVQVKHYVTGNDALISLAGPANKQGRIIADNICGGDSRYLGSQGSSVIKVFDMTAATTGINETNSNSQRYKLDVQDYGGFVKSPVGNRFSDKFVLVSIICQINFLLYGVEQWIKEEIPTKLRFGYILYFYLINVVEQINTKLGITLKIDTKWKSDRFRNAMAHYKLGIVLKEDELINSDVMFGLTRKLLGEDYLIVKKSIYKELKGLAKQIGEYLELPKRMVYLQ